MQERKHEFRLSAKELEYLRELTTREKSLSDLFGLVENPSGHRITVRLTGAEVERLRDYLTKQLATVGFDADYRPNDEGQMLEELIDRFYYH